MSKSISEFRDQATVQTSTSRKRIRGCNWVATLNFGDKFIQNCCEFCGIDPEDYSKKILTDIEAQLVAKALFKQKMNARNLVTSFAETHCKWLIMASEHETQETHHLQIAFTLHKPRDIKWVIDSLPGCHIERMEGTSFQAREYCLKEDKEPFEFGVVPEFETAGKREQNRWAEILELVRTSNFEELASRFPQEFLLHNDKLVKNAQRLIKPPPIIDGELKDHFFWVYGTAGCGKTKKAFEMHKQFNLEPEQNYLKLHNKWWDSYNPEVHDCVILDDISPTDEGWLEHLLRTWLDRYPFKAEFKGGSMDIRPRHIILTSQYHFCRIFSNLEMREAISRRVSLIELGEPRPENQFKDIHDMSCFFVTPPPVLKRSILSEFAPIKERVEPSTTVAQSLGDEMDNLCTIQKALDLASLSQTEQTAVDSAEQVLDPVTRPSTPAEKMFKGRRGRKPKVPTFQPVKPVEMVDLSAYESDPEEE